MATFLSPASTQLTALVQSTAVDRGPIPLPRPRPKRLWLPASARWSIPTWHKSGCGWRI